MNSEQRSESEKIVVNVSAKGQATIPHELREKHGIDAPGKVRWYENEAGELVVEPVRSITEFRGAGSSDKSAREMLEEGREVDRERRERLERMAERTE